MLRESPSQTAGPYVHIGCAPRSTGIAAYAEDLGTRIMTDATPGERITLTGTIFDGADAPVSDAMVELWQAPAANAGAAFTGSGRATCDQDGVFRFDTIKPGASDQAPHVTLWIVARSINIGLHTRAYFEGDDHSSDPVLAQVPPARRATLIARQTAPGSYHLDIHLQGPNETVFFDI